MNTTPADRPDHDRLANVESDMAEELESANPDSLEGDDGQEYEVTDWEVTAEFIPAKKGARR